MKDGLIQCGFVTLCVFRIVPSDDIFGSVHYNSPDLVLSHCLSCVITVTILSFDVMLDRYTNDLFKWPVRVITVKVPKPPTKALLILAMLQLATSLW